MPIRAAVRRGFVRVDAQGALLIPDAPGNNRLGSLENIVASGRIGLLFMTPGVDETLRVNGSAVVTRDAAEMQVFVGDPRPPRLVIKVSVEAAYLHCAKAFMRSRLWSADAQIDRRSLPTAGQMISEQTGVSVPPETQEAMVARYQADL